MKALNVSFIIASRERDCNDYVNCLKPKFNTIPVVPVSLPGYNHFPYRPRLVLNGVGDIPAEKALPSAASACIIEKTPGQAPQGAPDSKGKPPCLKGAAK